MQGRESNCAASGCQFARVGLEDFPSLGNANLDWTVRSHIRISLQRDGEFKATKPSAALVSFRASAARAAWLG